MHGLLSGRSGIGNLFAGLRRPVTGSAPATNVFKQTMAIGGTGVTFRDAVSLVNGDFNLVTYYTVQAQEKATFGWGKASEPVNQGYIHFQLQTGVPAAIDGPTRLVLEDAHGAQIAGGVVMEEQSTRMDGSTTDRDLQLPLPQWSLFATEDSRLAVRVNPSATATVSESDSTVQLPITLAIATG